MPDGKTSKIVVIGIGNEFRRDDGVGIAVARRLKNRLPESVKIIEQSGEAASLMEAWQGAESVIVIDAISSGAPPGTVRRVDLTTAEIPAGLCRSSSHHFGVAEAVGLARELKRLPARLVLIGIEGEDFSEGTECSEKVTLAIECASDVVLDAVGVQNFEPLKTQRLLIQIQGTVQGVGFRPFVYQLAKSLDLSGWVENAAQGVSIEAYGTQKDLNALLDKIRHAAPVHSVVTKIESTVLKPQGGLGFEIRESTGAGERSADILPDLAPCADCLHELFDPLNRRYHYPFINCTHCGPRFSILEGIPYDRSRTSMKNFILCALCRTEYDDPNNRRFHAQANTCAHCGPQLVYWDAQGQPQAEKKPALLLTVEALRDGKIIAMKGVGGFHLMVDARNEAAVLRLRQKKNRPRKPFALLYPALEDIQKACLVSEVEAAWLRSPAAPIVLVTRRKDDSHHIAAAAVAPDNPDLGVMLPTSPLHHLLMALLAFPVIATSANLSNEPICTDEYEALERLKRVADGFLIHDRPIVRPLEDSVVRVMAGRAAMLRRARGFPLFSVPLPTGPRVYLSPLLALGGQIKNTVAISNGTQIRLGPHMGNLETAQAIEVFENGLEDLKNTYNIKARHIVCDVHPDYITTHKAQASGLPLTRVQHHHAHVAACMAEHGLTGTVLGVAWDGTGFGTDGTLWGGEFLRASAASFERFAHLRPFPLPGGPAAIREPRRAALGLLYALVGEKCFEMSHLPPLASFSNKELQIIKTMLEKDLNAPRTASAGRLFDAAGSILGLRQGAGFEGEAAMALEFAARNETAVEGYLFEMQGHSPVIADWGPMVHAILHDLAQSVSIGSIAARFHTTLAEMIVALAVQAEETRVVLSGGCFQNRLLLERAVDRLKKAGFEVYWPQAVPCNDGGLALGQAFVAVHQLGENKPCV